jgi:hypothetical protein
MHGDFSGSIAAAFIAGCAAVKGKKQKNILMKRRRPNRGRISA